MSDTAGQPAIELLSEKDLQDMATTCRYCGQRVAIDKEDAPLSDPEAKAYFMNDLQTISDSLDRLSGNASLFLLSSLRGKIYTMRPHFRPSGEKC